MKNSEIEQIIDKLLSRITQIENSISDLKQVIVWREQGVLKDGTEMRDKMESMDKARAEAVHRF